MKRIMLSLFALGLAVLGLASILPSLPPQLGVHNAVQADTETALNLDVACDCRTFAFIGGAFSPRGDVFIISGKVFPAGTLPVGPASNDPNDPGSIGDWTCRGTVTGVPDPFAFITQYHLLANGGLVSESPTGVHAAVVGGMGAFSGAGGELSAEEIGPNITGCPNLRFTFNLKKQAPK